MSWSLQLLGPLQRCVLFHFLGETQIWFYLPSSRFTILKEKAENYREK